MSLLMQTLVLQRLRTELPRCRRLAAEIESLGSAGAFAGALLRASIERAEYANASADPVAMSRSLAELELFDGAQPAPMAFAPKGTRARSARADAPRPNGAAGPLPTWQ